MQESHPPQKPFTGYRVIKEATASMHGMHFPYVLWMKLLATGPKMSEQNESSWYALYFRTMFSSEPVFCGGAASQQCLPIHFPYMFGQSPSPLFEISWRALLQWHWPNKGAAVLSSLTLSSPALQVLASLGKKPSLNIKRKKNFNTNVLLKTTSV